METLADPSGLLGSLPDGLFIGGRWVPPVNNGAMASVSPSTGKTLRDFAAGSAPDVDRAVTAAREAFAGPWARWRPYDRQRLILRFADLVAKYADELSALDVLDMGLPVTPARGFDEILQRGLHFYASAATAARGEVLPTSMPAAQGHYQAYTVKEPAGVIGAIVSWNGPRWQFCKKLGATLATGCTLVLKPSEEATLTALRFAQIAQEAGVPDGVLNVVPGGPDVGAALARHDGVDRIVFVGSGTVGRQIYDEAKHSLKRLTLELGGKAPHIVFDDADTERAAFAAAIGAFANAGQFCIAGSRLFVHRPIADEFTAAVVKETEKLVVGPSTDPRTQIGPLISGRHRDRVRGYLRTAATEGASLLTGGEGSLNGTDGFYLAPSVLGGVSDEMTVAREEIFGPVLSVLVFDDLDEVIHRANDTPYGLNAGVWSNSLDRVSQVVGGLRTGTVWVNDYLPLEPLLPHGGFKQSGMGREGGMEQIDEYLETKAVLIRSHG
jgi:aldehyde dehydrogenase (NAD+)